MVSFVIARSGVDIVCVHMSSHPSYPTIIGVLSILAVCFLAGTAHASVDEHDAGIWFAVAGQGHVEHPDPDARLRWWFDAHARFTEDSKGYDTSIVRPGVGYDVAKNATLWLGYAWIRNGPRRENAFDEHRIWQQFTWSEGLGPGNFFSRTRLEQRFDERDDDTGWRARQFVRWTQPSSDGSRLSLRIWDEAFFDLNETDWGADPGFRQNRAFVGVGWNFAAAKGGASSSARFLTLEVGYLNQFFYRTNAEDEMNHILGVNLLVNR